MKFVYGWPAALLLLAALVSWLLGAPWWVAVPLLALGCIALGVAFVFIMLSDVGPRF